MQFMKPAFRNGSYCYAYTVSRSLLLTLNPNPFFFSSPIRPLSIFSSSMASTHFSSTSALSLEKQFGEFRTHLEESGTLRDRIRTVVSEIESTTRLMYANILLVHHSRPTPGTNSSHAFLEIVFLLIVCWCFFCCHLDRAFGEG